MAQPEPLAELEQVARLAAPLAVPAAVVGVHVQVLGLATEWAGCLELVAGGSLEGPVLRLEERDRIVSRVGHACGSPDAILRAARSIRRSITRWVSVLAVAVASPIVRSRKA